MIIFPTIILGVATLAKAWWKFSTNLIDSVATVVLTATGGGATISGSRLTLTGTDLAANTSAPTIISAFPCSFSYTINCNGVNYLQWQLNEGSGSTTTDNTGNGHTGTLVGSPTWATGWDGTGYSLLLDGTQMGIQSATTATPIIMSIYFKIDSLATANSLITFSQDDVTSSPHYYKSLYIATDGTINFYSEDPGGGGFNKKTTLTVSTGVWHRITLECHSNNRLIRGSLDYLPFDGDFPYTHTADMDWSLINKVRIGYSMYGGSFSAGLTGSIDNIIMKNANPEDSTGQSFFFWAGDSAITNGIYSQHNNSTAGTPRMIFATLNAGVTKYVASDFNVAYYGEDINIVHVCPAQNSSNWKTYYNGIDVTSVLPGGDGTFPSDVSRLYVGGLLISGSPDSCLHGTMKNFKMYDYALSAGEAANPP